MHNNTPNTGSRGGPRGRGRPRGARGGRTGNHGTSSIAGSSHLLEAAHTTQAAQNLNLKHIVVVQVTGDVSLWERLKQDISAAGINIFIKGGDLQLMLAFRLPQGIQNPVGHLVEDSSGSVFITMLPETETGSEEQVSSRADDELENEEMD